MPVRRREAKAEPQSLPKSLAVPKSMNEHEGQEFLVYNLTQESFLSFGVTLVDVTLEPFKELLRRLSTQVGTGLWLTPYCAIPALHELNPVDLVLLDENHRVIQTVESISSIFFEPSMPQAASVLVLPAHIIYSSQTEAADQLIICGADGLEQRLQRLSHVALRVPTPLSLDSEPNVPPCKGGPPSLLSGDHFSQMQGTVQQVKDEEESQTRKKDSFMDRLCRSLAGDRRRATRYPSPGLVAYYWTGGPPKACLVGDLSTTGLYLFTKERWFPGSVIPLTLQKTDTDGRAPEDWIAVQTQVVRLCSDGRGLAFIFSRIVDQSSGDTSTARGANRMALEQFLRQLKLQ